MTPAKAMLVLVNYICICVCMSSSELGIPQTEVWAPSAKYAVPVLAETLVTQKCFNHTPTTFFFIFNIYEPFTRLFSLDCNSDKAKTSFFFCEFVQLSAISTQVQCSVPSSSLAVYLIAINNCTLCIL